EFTLGGKTYKLAANDGPNTLHGGVKRSLDKVVWKATPIVTTIGEHVMSFEYVSPAGEEGFPGKLSLHVTYTLHLDNKLTIRYEAETNKATPVNLTNHTYFNLAGAGTPSVLDHVLMVNGDK